MNKTNMAAPSMGFTPEDMKSISSVLGYTGDSSGFADYLSQNPQAHDSFMGIQRQRTQFNNGGFVATQHMANGGLAQGQYASDDPVLDDFLNAGYLGGTPFFNESTGQYIPSLTLSDGRTLTREQFDSWRQVSNEPDMYFKEPSVYNTGNTSQQLPQPQQNTITNTLFDPQAGNIMPMPTQDAPTSRAEQNLANVQVPQIGVESAVRLQDPSLPAAAIYSATQTPTEAAQLVNPATAQLTGDVTIGQAGQAQASQGAGPNAMTAASVTAAQAAPDVRDLAAQTVASQTAAPTQAITAVQQGDTSVGQLQAAQTAGAQVQAPTPRQLQAGEIIASPTGQAAQAATFVQPTAAVATPSSQATVQGQLASLISEFTDTEVPLWARGAVDNARAVLLQRGIGASSMAGQAIVEAAMRAALPIAQVDAATIAGF
jgi:hypothetical protein